MSMEKARPGFAERLGVAKQILTGRKTVLQEQLAEVEGAEEALGDLEADYLEIINEVEEATRQVSEAMNKLRRKLAAERKKVASS